MIASTRIYLFHHFTVEEGLVLIGVLILFNVFIWWLKNSPAWDTEAFYQRFIYKESTSEEIESYFKD